MTDVFRFLKGVSAEETYINSLFISAYVKLNGLVVCQNNIVDSFPVVDECTLNSFISIVQKLGQLDLEKLVRLFEFVISPSDRIVNGAIYTPKPIRIAIISHCLGKLDNEQLDTVRICDISCGCGGFLMDVAEYIHKKTGKDFYKIFEENIFGIDVQAYAIKRTKILLSLLALTYGEDYNFNFNLLQADTLDYCMEGWNSDYTSFDVIVGNPPYVCSRNVSVQTKEKMLRYEVSHSGHPDLYIPFFQIADGMLKDSGILGFITMNSFIRSVNGRSLRRYFSTRKRNVSIVDFRGYQVFDKKSTYTCLFFMNKGVKSESVSYIVNETGNIRLPLSYITIPYSSLDDYKGWNLNDNNEIEMIEGIGKPIGKYCDFRHGIATLSNKIYIFRPIREDADFYYLQSENVVYPIERNICRSVVNSNKLNSEVDFASIVEKVIYPYHQIQGGKMRVIDEERMQREFPCTYEYLISKKHILAQRDKGKTEKYPTWYAFGRTQSLKMPRYKLFFPKFANRPINCVLKDDAKLLLYNGIAFVSDNLEKLQIVQKIIESDFFWQYIVKNAKPYSSKYYSLSGVDIKNFGVPDFSEDEKKILHNMNDKVLINEWLAKFY